MPTHEEISKLAQDAEALLQTKRLEVHKLQQISTSLRAIDFLSEQKEETYEVDVPAAGDVPAHKETRTKKVTYYEKMPKDLQMPEAELLPERQQQVFDGAKAAFESIPA